MRGGHIAGLAVQAVLLALVLQSRAPVLIAVAAMFLFVILFLPLLAVFVEAFRRGIGAYLNALTDPDALAFEAADVLERVDELGDLYADSVTLEQELPQL